MPYPCASSKYELDVMTAVILPFVMETAESDSEPDSEPDSESDGESENVMTGSIGSTSCSAQPGLWMGSLIRERTRNPSCPHASILSVSPLPNHSTPQGTRRNAQWLWCHLLPVLHCLLVLRCRCLLVLRCVGIHAGRHVVLFVRGVPVCTQTCGSTRLHTDLSKHPFAHRFVEAPVFGNYLFFLLQVTKIGNYPKRLSSPRRPLSAHRAIPASAQVCVSRSVCYLSIFNAGCSDRIDTRL